MNATPGTSIKVCDLCSQPLQAVVYDAKTSSGSWGYLCDGCFETDGAKLGVGLGQRFVKKADGSWERDNKASKSESTTPDPAAVKATADFGVFMTITGLRIIEESKKTKSALAYRSDVLGALFGMTCGALVRKAVRCAKDGGLDREKFLTAFKAEMFNEF